MPQPLSRFHPTLGATVALGKAPHTPEMAVAVLGVINFWAQIDYNYGSILARVAKADPVTVTAVFQATISADARKSAMIAAVQEKLTLEEASLILSVIEASKPSRDLRNEFAHHVWGSLNTRSDCVLLVNPRTLAKFNAAMTAWRGEGPRPELDRSKVIVWRQKDFDTALKDAHLAHMRTYQLLFTFDHVAADQRR